MHLDSKIDDSKMGKGFKVFHTVKFILFWKFVHDYVSEIASNMHAFAWPQKWSPGWFHLGLAFIKKKENDVVKSIPCIKDFMISFDWLD